MRKKADSFFFWIVIAIALGGFFIFTSASLGLLARETGAEFQSVFFNQVFLGLFGGLAAFFAFSRLDYSWWRKLSLPLFILALIATALVFAPGIGMEHNGARRWLDLGIISLQPTEILKFAFVCFFAAWVAMAKERIASFRWGLLPFAGFLGVMGVLVLLQPDTGTFGVIAAAGLIMFFAAGAKWRDIFLLVLAGVLAVALLAFFRPYVKDRIDTFLHPERDQYGAGYQISQSLIAIGSGGAFGRGFGQSIQKFNYLPEPTNDAIFAVAAEEFGFAGGVAIILAFLLFAFRGFFIANRARDVFGRMLAIGFVSLIAVQSFINIASMLALFPLTGVPLLFISHGGTALALALVEAGIILNISRTMRR